MGVFFGPQKRNLGDLGDRLIPERPGASRSTAGQNVTESSAMTLSVVWDCVRLRADIVSTLPLDVFRNTSNGKVNIAKPPVLTNPGGDRVDICEWLYSSQVSLDLRGNAYGIIVDVDGLGYPRQIELQHPDRVVPKKDKDGRVVYLIGGKKYEADEVWHERAFTVAGSPVGLSPIAYAARTMGVVLAAETFGADWFGDGAHPSSVLTTDKPVTDSAAREIKKKFMAAVKGTREPVVLGLGVKYAAIQVSPNESQFLETMKFGGQGVCRFFGVPPELVGLDSGSSMTYTNVEQRSIDFLTYRLGPTLVRREKALTRLTPRPQYVKFNVDALLRTDTLTRYKAHAIGIGAHFLLQDEAREYEDLRPLTDEERAELDKVPLQITPTGGPKDGAA